MSTPNPISAKMEYIQEVFLGVQNYMCGKPPVDDLIAFLDEEPPEFRSVAYESASMALGLLDLTNGTQLQQWKAFYLRFEKVHSLHLDIGLGWAFAKLGMISWPGWEPMHSLMRWMIFDGIGYYYGLFRGRRTVRNQLTPPGMEIQDGPGFDQGLGRRLWYMSKGDAGEATRLVRTFPSSRSPDLWRGVGIACGYVGGARQADLELLAVAAAQWGPQLRTGIALAAKSRHTSNSVTEDIELACQVLCGMPLEEVVGLQPGMVNEPAPGKRPDYWMKQIESIFA